MEPDAACSVRLHAGLYLITKLLEQNQFTRGGDGLITHSAEALV